MKPGWYDLLDTLSPGARLSLARGCVALPRLEIEVLGSSEALAGLDRLLTEAADRGVDFEKTLRLLRDIPEFHAPPQMFDCLSIIGGVLITTAEVLTGFRGLTPAALDQLAVIAMDWVWASQPDSGAKFAEDNDWDDPKFQQPPYVNEWNRIQTLAERLAADAPKSEVETLMTRPAEDVVQTWYTQMKVYGCSREKADEELDQLRAIQETDPESGVVWTPDLEDLSIEDRDVLANSCVRVAAVVASMCGLDDLVEALCRLVNEDPPRSEGGTVALDDEQRDWITERVDCLITALQTYREDRAASSAHQVALEAIRLAGAYLGRDQDLPFVPWDEVRNFDVLSFRNQSQYDEWLRQRSIILAFRKGRSVDQHLEPRASLGEAFAGSKLPAATSDEELSGPTKWLSRLLGGRS